ncbi:MAG: NAAT family transporter [Cyanobacteria bacterium P01_D01_bin.105]
MDWSGLLDWEDYVKLLVGLLSLADPIGNLPIILTLTEKHSYQEKARFFRSSVITFIVTLSICSLIGTYILNLFGITVAALKVAGGILFLFYALDMLEVIQLPQTANPQKEQNYKPIGIVPIGIPILAGPGTITKVIIYSDLHNSFAHNITVIVAIVTVGGIIHALFRSLLLFNQGIDKTTMSIVVKVMGLLLAGIAVEFILEGIVEFLAKQAVSLTPPIYIDR